MAKNRKLGKPTDQRLAMLKNQTTDLLVHGKIETTEGRAKEVKAMAEKYIIRIEGIGAPTKAYFWINAFIRELIAGLVMEKKRHLKVIAVIFAANVLLCLIRYLSVQ